MCPAVAWPWRGCIPALDKLKLQGDEEVGVNIVKRALQEPLRQIAQNAGEEGAIVFGRDRFQGSTLRFQRVDR